MSKISLFITLFFVGLSQMVSAQEYYRDTEAHINTKKEIIKAVVQHMSPRYLQTIENQEWEDEAFYASTEELENIGDILHETSGFVAVNNPLVFDGDKIFAQTGNKVTDIPGSGVVVYDGRIKPDYTLNYADFDILDGDKIWVETGSSYQVLPNNSVIVYDCLFPPDFNCGHAVKQEGYSTAFALPITGPKPLRKEPALNVQEQLVTVTPEPKTKVVKRLIYPGDPEYDIYKKKMRIKPAEVDAGVAKAQVSEHVLVGPDAVRKYISIFFTTLLGVIFLYLSSLLFFVRR